MFTRILIPLDGSARAERALPVAARLARSSSGTLLLTSVAHPMPVLSMPLEISRDLKSYVDDELAAAKEYLTQVSRRADLAGVHTEIVTAVGGPVAEEVVELALEHHADLIVMCSHGRSGLAHWALGSVAQHVVRTTPVPVLVLKADGSTLVDAKPETSAGPIRVLVPLDGSPLAERAIEPAAQLATALAAPGEATVHLLHVIEYPVVVYPAFTPSALPPADSHNHHQLQDKASAYLHTVAQRFAEEPLNGLRVQVVQSVVFDEDAATAIAAAARHAPGSDATAGTGVALIAMATHGRTGLARVTVGSVTERVLQVTKRPLFVVRPEPATAQGEPALPRAHRPDAGDVSVAPLF
jgi:nucleotide-binding universal stress UspA family protein